MLSLQAVAGGLKSLKNGCRLNRLCGGSASICLGGDHYIHGTMFYKAIKLGLIDAERSVSIGIRTDNPDTRGVNILDARWVHENGSAAVARRVKEIVGTRETYVTFDIDCLDPAFAPGTGTPVWGGLASWQAAAILRELAGINMVGGDIVEVSPPFDTTGATAIAGAHVAVELLSLWGWNHLGKDK